MKVLFVIDTLSVGGAERSVVALATSLQHWRPDLVTMYAGDALAPLLGGLPHVDIGDEQRSYAWKQGTERLRRIVRARRPDVLHSTLFRSDQMTRVVGAQLGIPVVSSLVSDSYGAARVAGLSRRACMKLAAVQCADRSTAPLVDTFIANSEAAASAGVKDLALDERRVIVIPRGRDLKRFRPPLDCERVAARTALGLLENQHVAVTVGRLIASKDQALLIRAFARIRRDNDHLVVVGDGPERASLEALAVDSGVASSITFCGARDDVETILRAADFFVFASAFEGAPGAVLEAMATGLPSVLSDIAAVRELADRDCAAFFQPGDVDACCRAWQHLLASPDARRAEMGAAARRRSERFSLTAMVARHEAVYASVVARKRRGE